MSKNQYRLLILAKLAISTFLIGVIVSRVNLSDVWSAFVGSDKRLIVMAFILYFVGFCIIALRWKLLLDAQGLSPRYLTLIQSVMVAVFFNNFLPSTIGGDAMRAYDTWKMGGGKTQSVSVVFIDRLLGIFTLFVFALLAILWGNAELSFIPNIRLWVALAVLAGVVALYVLFFRARQVSDYLQRHRHRKYGVISRPLEKIFSAFAGFNGKPGVLMLALLLSVLLQLNVIAHYYLIAHSLGIDIELSAMFIIVPVSIVVMMIPLSINAIGIREVIFVAMFALYGVANADALAFAWLSFILGTVLGISGGIVFMLRRRIAADIEVT
ncbi:MAG: lysylphosphatidylglycerol synthase transmembrane domain-containing protein [Pseudomonadota bacterium]|nr:lysylphosphatidylglycerol synthase transmembrane domain-containing protein [Pseudomonadota bacterium]